MLIDKNIKFHLNDISLVPAKTSKITSRSEVNINYISDGRLTLPLIVAPMDTVIDHNNYDKFLYNDIPVCIPRTYSKYYVKIINKHKNTSDLENMFFSYSLDEIEIILKKRKAFTFNVLIDMANGHMERLLRVVRLFKLIQNPKIKLMVGNIANPSTYKSLAEAGANLCRLSIGGGSACTTSANVSIHYPIGSLISECKTIKNDNLLDCKIIADGGFKNFDQIIKALALGADYVMIGGIFSKTIDSLTEFSKPKLFNKININNKIAKWFFENTKFTVYKKYRGMSTKDAQKSWDKKVLKTSEGIKFYNKIEFNLNGWVENFSDYLKSAMSYCDCQNLNEFIGQANYVFISHESFNAFKK